MVNLGNEKKKRTEKGRVRKEDIISAVKIVEEQMFEQYKNYHEEYHPYILEEDLIINYNDWKLEINVIDSERRPYTEIEIKTRSKKCIFKFNNNKEIIDFLSKIQIIFHNIDLSEVIVFDGMHILYAYPSSENNDNYKTRKGVPIDQFMSNISTNKNGNYTYKDLDMGDDPYIFQIPEEIQNLVPRPRYAHIHLIFNIDKMKYQKIKKFCTS